MSHLHVASKLNQSFFSVEACADDGQDELSGELESRAHESPELEEPTGKSMVRKVQCLVNLRHLTYQVASMLLQDVYLFLGRDLIKLVNVIL